MRTLIVDKKNNGKKINTFLLDSFPNLNINTIFKALRKKDIRVNGKRISSNIILYYNDEITIYIPDNLLLEHQNNINYSTIYEDNNIIIINKPIGIEITGNNSLTELLSKKYAYCQPCHRLDRNTSGIVIFAKTPSALDILFNKFKNREIIKHYVCLVYGKLPKFENTLTAYLFKDSKKSIVYISSTPKKGYQEIITSYKVLEYYNNNTSLLDITLHTGRTHQIRAHLAHIGYPIIGDGKYGINEINKTFRTKTQKLCSYYLQFNFTTDAGILNYLNHKKFQIEYNF